MADEPTIEIPFTLFLALGRYLTQRPWAEVNPIIQGLHGAELAHQAKIAEHVKTQAELAAQVAEAARLDAAAETPQEPQGNHAEAVPA